jgi:hypothetical protein
MRAPSGIDPSVSSTPRLAARRVIHARMDQALRPRIAPVKVGVALSLATAFGAPTLLACGPAVTPRSVYPSLTTARGTRRIVEMTDIEEVRDVARSGSTTYVATDDGLLIFEGGAPTRIGRAEGLPSEDVTAVAIDRDGSALVGVGAALVRVASGAAAPVDGAPPVARITDLAVMEDGTAWACTLSGLARRGAGGWEIFGERFPCTTLAPTPEGALWAGSAQGLFYVEGDVVREHPISGGIPEGYVRSIVPVLPGQILALLAGPSRSVLGFFDGSSWHAYALPGVEERVAGLVAIDGSTTVLVTEERIFAVAPTGQGTRFRAFSSELAQTRSFRAETVAAAAAPAAPAVDASDVLRGMQSFTGEASEATAGRAPALVARELTNGLPPGAYRAFQSGPSSFAAIGNRGIVSLGTTATTPLRSMSLVSEEDLQVVTDLESGVWVRGRDGDIAKWIDGRLRRLGLPDEIVPQAIASGPQGCYLVALVRGTSTVRVYVAQGSGFRALVERALSVPTSLLSTPFAGVGNDGRIWIGLRVAREDGAGARMRGVAVLDPSSEAVLYHHRQAGQGQGLPLADEVSAVAFDATGDAWFATLSGAVRVEDHQAITFDESRGVRGDVVTDVVAGAGNMWIASAEGLGSYEDRRFDYSLPAVVREHRPVALAIDARGTLWAAGRYGLLANEGGQWAHFGRTESDAQGRIVPGLPVAELRDVETDGQGRVWLLTPESVLVLAP